MLKVPLYPILLSVGTHFKYRDIQSFQAFSTTQTGMYVPTHTHLIFTVKAKWITLQTQLLFPVNKITWGSFQDSVFFKRYYLPPTPPSHI